MSNQLLKKTQKFGFSTLCFIFIIACSRTPKGIISEKEMRRVLVDMQLAEAMINMNPQDYRTNEEKTALYQSVFEKYSLTEAEYDSSLVWYGRNLDLYMRIYNLALTDVKKRIELMGDVKPEAVSTTDGDSIDIWMYRRYYEFSPLNLSNTIILDFKPNREYASGCIFLLSFQVWGISSAIPQTIDMKICADQNDTTLIVNKVINADGKQELMLKTLPTKRVKRIYGYIRLNEKKESAYPKIYLDDFQLMKFNYGSAYIAQMDSTTSKDNNINQ